MARCCENAIHAATQTKLQEVEKFPVSLWLLGAGHNLAVCPGVNGVLFSL